MSGLVLHRPAFIAEADWARMDEDGRFFWHQLGADLEWLAKQPPFRRFLVAFHEHQRYGAASASTHRASDRDTIYANGRRDLVIQLRADLQATAPGMWMRALNEFHHARRPGDGPPATEEP